VSGRKHNKIKIDSFEYILLFFSSTDAKASPKEIKPNRSKASSGASAIISDFQYALSSKKHKARPNQTKFY